MIDDSPQVIRIGTADTLSLGVNDSQVELWMAGSYAPAWFHDAKQQATLDDDTDDMAKPREIVFAVCAIESYLGKWVRDEVLNRNYQRLKHYFPVDKKYVGIADRWRQVIIHLFEDGTISRKPDLGQQYWADFDKLVQFRNGLVQVEPADRTPIPLLICERSQAQPTQN